MNNRKILIIVLVLLSFFFASKIFGMGEKPRAGIAAIDFTARDLFGYEQKLSDYYGKVIFLNFWATWCPPCRAEMPSIQKLYEQLVHEDFVILAVSVDKEGEPVVRPFLDQTGYTFPVLLDPRGKAASKYGVRGIPATFIINRDGMIVEKFVGSRNWADRSVIQKIRGLL